MPTIPSDAHVVNDTGHTTDHDNLVDVVGTLIVIAGQLYQLTMATPVNNTNNQPNLNTLATMVGSSATAVLSTQITATSLVLAGYGPPAVGLGFDGDSYINLTNSQRYNRQSGAWVQSVTANPMAGWGLLAATSASGVALINGAQTILSYTFPSDGAMHRMLVCGTMNVATAETGGQVNLSFVNPAGTSGGVTAWNSALGTGFRGVNAGTYILAQGGSTVTLNQTATAPSPLTAGAATVWAEFWGS